MAIAATVENLDPFVKQAINEIAADFGDAVSVTNRAGSVRKFGFNTGVGTSYETVWETGGDETYAATDLITHFASGNAGDAGAMVVQGETIDGSGNFTAVSQSVTVAGQTKTALTTPLARVNRAYNDSATDWVGDVYVAEDVTFTSGVPASGVHLTVPAGRNQSFKAALTLPSTDYLILTRWGGGVREKTAAAVDLDLQVRLKGKAFRTRDSAAAHTNAGEVPKPFGPYMVIPPNSDIRIRALSSAANTSVGAWFFGYYASVTA